jgi:hypothetical protein
LFPEGGFISVLFCLEQGLFLTKNSITTNLGRRLFFLFLVYASTHNE